MRKLFIVSCVMFALVSAPSVGAVDTGTVTRIYNQLQAPEASTPLLGMYQDIHRDALIFPYESTATEFKEKYGISSPIFPGGLESENVLSKYTAIGQLNAFRQYQTDYQKMLIDAQFFTDAYLYAKYKNIFTNDDISDSEYDLMVKAHELVTLVDPTQSTVTSMARYPGFSGGLSAVSKRIMGDRYASVITDKDIRNQEIDALKQSGGYVFGTTTLQDQCALPGSDVVMEKGTAALTGEEKNAVLGRIVDLEEVKKIEDSAKNISTLLPNQYEKPMWLRVLEGEQIPGQRWCLDRICLSINAIYKQPRLAQRKANFIAINETLAAFKSVLEDAKTRDLTAQCAVKKAFGSPWYDKQIKPVFSPPIITFVPMFVELEYSKIITGDLIFNAVREWNAIASSPIQDQDPLRLEASESIVSASDASIAAIADIETRKELYLNTIALRADFQNQHEHMKIVSKEFTSLQNELTVFLNSVMNIRKTVEKMKQIPIK